MERSEIMSAMGELKLYGMKSAFDEIIATAVKRQHEPQRIVGDLLTAEEQVRVQQGIASLQLAAVGDNCRQIMLAMDDLEADTKDFAARRMDKSIRRAFAGRNINDLDVESVAAAGN